MTKSTFANGLQSLTPEQFDQVTKELLAEATRRDAGWDRVGSMTDNEFAAFSQRALADAENGKKASALNAEAAKVGKVLADPKAAEENNEAENDDGTAA